jgi:hypothetical protein
MSLNSTVQARQTRPRLSLEGATPARPAVVSLPATSTPAGQSVARRLTTVSRRFGLGVPALTAVSAVDTLLVDLKAFSGAVSGVCGDSP